MKKARRAAPGSVHPQMDPRMDAVAARVHAAFHRVVPEDMAPQARVSLAGDLLLHEIEAAANAAGEPVVEVLIRVVTALVYAQTGDPAVIGLPPEVRH